MTADGGAALRPAAQMRPFGSEYVTRKQRIITGTAVIALIAAAVGVALVVRTGVRAIDMSLEAEERLHATILVSDIVGDFVEMNGFTRWPASWVELESVPPRHWSTYRWPDDLARLRELVNIDFEADLEQVAAEKVESFTAVEPAGVCYEVWTAHAAGPLLERIRKGRLAMQDLPLSPLPHRGP